MSRLSFALDLIGFGVGLAYLVFRIGRHRRIRIDHVLLFVVGHMYYVSLSSILAHVNAYRERYVNVFATFDAVAPSRRAAVSAWSLLALLAFVAGSELVRRDPGHPRRSFSLRRASSSVVPAFAMAAGMLGVFLLACVQYRAVLLQGYASGDPTLIQEQAGRGLLAAIATASALATLFARHVYATIPTSRRRQATADVIAGCAVAVPILVLPIGGNRLYSVTLVLVVAIWLSNFRRPFRRGLVVIGATFGVLLLAMLGSLRVRELPSVNSLGYYTTAEGVLSAWSRDLYLTSPRPVLAPFAAPKYLVSDFINAVPRVVLPNKDDLRLDPEADGYRLTSPLGGVSATASLLINFGYVGSLAVLAVASAALKWMQLRALRRPWSIAAITYCVLAAAVGFSFYRDPFGISIVRWGLVSAVITVVALHVTARVAAAVGERPRYRGPGGASSAPTDHTPEPVPTG